jgi:hypothetical protein
MATRRDLPPLDLTRRRFEHFWEKYPKKRSKDAAQRRFFRIRPDGPTFKAIMEGLARAKQSPQWQEAGGRFIPYPATWLNAGGWKDELDEDAPTLAQLIRDRDHVPGIV